METHYDGTLVGQKQRYSMNVTCGRCGAINTEASQCRNCGEQLDQFRKRPRRARSRRFPLILTLVVVVPILIVVSFAVFVKVVFKTYYIPSGAMEPTFRIADVLLVNRVAYRGSEPVDGDIVVFEPPIPSSNPFIKRVIATPGETLRIHNGRLYRNAIAVDEPYVAQPTAYELEIKNYGIYVDGTPLDSSESNIPPREKWTSPDTLPRGCYFLMGDNRNNSEDSHIWGFAQRDGIVYSGPRAGRQAGSFEKATYIIAPRNRARFL